MKLKFCSFMMLRRFICTPLLCIACIFVSHISFAQSGPGGISIDTSSVYNCRLWFDAADLSNLSDGSEVMLWQDKSISEVVDNAIWNTSYQNAFPAPIFRDAPSSSINGHPVVSFESGGMLLIGENSQNPSTDLATNPDQYTTYKRTIFVAFRTGSDVMERQYIWEQGGGWRGINIYIYQGEIYMGVYDSRNDQDTGDGSVPKFGFSYKTAAIQPNTTYVVSLVYNAPEDNTLDYEGTSLKGTLNGQDFGDLQHAGNMEPGFGGLGRQDDPIGVGGINSETANETGYLSEDCSGALPCSGNSNNTGQATFKGRIAEMIYYAYNLNDAQRIIVENYLGAKYTANVIEHDLYPYQFNFGYNLIGVGKENEDHLHSVSQGDNMFEMRVDPTVAFTANTPQYLLAGANKAPKTWTSTLSPDPEKINRLERTWRWSRSGQEPENKNVEFRFDPGAMPPLPDGFSKYILLIDNQNQALPSFSDPDTERIELVYNSSDSTYRITTDIQDGAYMTLGALKPAVSFTNLSTMAMENGGEISVEVQTNYVVMSPGGVEVGLNFMDGTATNPEDYNPSETSILIPVGQRNASVNIDIIDNTDQSLDPSNNFQVAIDSSASNPPIHLGTSHIHTVNIYDNEYTVNALFTTSNSEFDEGNGTASLEITTQGTLSQEAVVRIIDQGTGTAVYVTDYILPSGEWSVLADGRRYIDIPFEAGTNILKTITLPIFEDNIDKENTTIHFVLVPLSGIGGNPTLGNLSHEITIIDNDNPPVAQSAITESAGYEVVSDPRIEVILSGPSGKIVEVPFSIIGGTATNGATHPISDYTAETTGVVIFPPGDTLSYLYYDPISGSMAISVDADGVPEPDETIIFELGDNPINATIGENTVHTYTIKDYEAFEWKGVAGIGQLRDNTIWIEPNAEPTGDITALTNKSNQPITLTSQTGSAPIISSPETGINSKKVLQFDGNKRVDIGNSDLSDSSPLINSGTYYDRKSIFFVLKPGLNSNDEQVIFEQGGTDKGLNIYLKNGKLYFQAWNLTDDDGSGNLAPWGGDLSYASSQSLNTGQAYVVSCHYNSNAVNGLEIFIDGALSNAYIGNVGRLYNHPAKAALGGVNNQTRFASGEYTDESGKHFTGALGDFIYYNEPLMNDARRIILHNHLSGKYNIPLTGNEQHIDLSYAQASDENPDFNYEIAGIGRVGDGNLHGDAQGPAEMRLNNPSFQGDDAFLIWGHNGYPFAEAWPFTSYPLPEGILQRSKRVWRMYGTNEPAVSKADITFEMGEDGDDWVFSQNPEHLHLLVHNNTNPNDFGTAVVYTTGEIENGNVVRFKNISIEPNTYLTLGSSEGIEIQQPEYLNLSAAIQAAAVQLFWATSVEINNDFFEIQRASENLQWHHIMSVNAVGESATPQSYTVQDPELTYGNTYYRIKLFDNDGSFVYSNVVTIFYTSDLAGSKIVVYPNPTSDGRVYMRIPHAVAGEDATIKVYNIAGKLIRDTKYIANTAIKEIDLQGAQTGMYIIKIESSLFSETVKVIVE